MAESILECFGIYGMPVRPNACEKCGAKELCRYVAERFVSKASLKPILTRLKALESRINVYKP